MQGEFTLPRHFERRVRAAIDEQLKRELFEGEYLPNEAELAQLLQLAFWSSLLRDEGRETNFIINLRPGTAPSTVRLERPLALTAQHLVRLSMATVPSVSALHVGPGPDGLAIWGIDTLLSAAAPVRIEVIAPATISVKSASATVARVSGFDAELIDRDVYAQYFFADTPSRTQPYADQALEHRFLDIARAMYAHGHGGTLLILGIEEPSEAELERSLERHFALARPFEGPPHADSEQASIHRALRHVTIAAEARELVSRVRVNEVSRDQYITALARTTVLDGATLVSNDGSARALGCKIRLSNEVTILRRRPTSASPSVVDLAEFGGTRHQSAARFVGNYEGTRAIISSQDGNVSIVNHRRKNEVDCLEHAEWIL
jgi:hypothetical protein